MDTPDFQCIAYHAYIGSMQPQFIDAFFDVSYTRFWYFGVFGILETRLLIGPEIMDTEIGGFPPFLALGNRRLRSSWPFIFFRARRSYFFIYMINLLEGIR